MNWYKKAQEEYTFFHGTDSPPFTEFNPSKATKGEQHYNPLGDAMYVTDKPEFAKMFGKNVYDVKIPKNAKIKRISPSKAESAIRDIIKRALEKVGIDYWQTDIGFRIQLRKLLENARWSPYDAIIESSELVKIEYQNKINTEEYMNWVSKLANQKFSKFDAVIFIGTNNPNDIYIGETPTKEILIFNKSFQKVFQPN